MTLKFQTYDVTRPDGWASGVIIASPHSGCDYPDWFLREAQLPHDKLRSSEDAFVDRLIASAPGHGAVTICARIPRCVVDLNRAPDEIDPALVRDVPRYPLNQRTLAGLGVIPRVVSNGVQIQSHRIARDEAERRIDSYWRPYHAALGALIDEARARFGHAILIDMHSMPREALAHLNGPRPDIVLGDRHGLSAAARISNAVAGALTDQGWRLRRNTPFSGAYIAAAYGRPQANFHVVQVEIDRSLYMDEASITPRADFDDFAARLDRALAVMARIGAGRGGVRLAAE